jgi:hypothetical protein
MNRLSLLRTPSPNELFSHPLRWAGKHLAFYAGASLVAGSLFVVGAALYARFVPLPPVVEQPNPPPAILPEPIKIAPPSSMPASPADSTVISQNIPPKGWLLSDKAADLALKEIARSDKPLKQIVLSEKQVQGVIAAQKDLDALTAKLPDNVKPDPKVTAQLDAAAKKNGFASYDEYNDVVDNISLVLAAMDPTSKKYVGFDFVIKTQIANVQTDKKMSLKDKKEALADLNQALKSPVPPIEYKGNIDLVVKYYDKLAEALANAQQ